MKRPLSTHVLRFIRGKYLRIMTIAILGMLAIANEALSQTYSQSECTCLNNSTTATNGQYRESITINSGVSGQTWRILNPIGFYNTFSPAPPASPILYLNNTIIPESPAGSGIYTLAGIRVSGTPWSVTATNGAAVRAFSSSVSCAYPSAISTAISGPGKVCPVATSVYSIPANANLSNILWSIPAGGSINSGQGTNTITVFWFAVSDTYRINVTADLVSSPGQSQPCAFTSTRTVVIVNPIPATTLQGDFGNCVGARETYRIDATALQLVGVTWGIFTDPAGMNPAAITSVGSINSQTVTWSQTGTYYIRVRGEYKPDPTMADFCSFSSTRQVVIVNELITPSLACNNLTNVSMNPNCELSFTPDQFLEDPIFASTSYDIILRDREADTIVRSGTLGLKYINKILEVKIVHECSGNSCWGLVKIEDKAIPDLVCPDDAIVNCDDLGDFEETGFPVFPVNVTLVASASKPNTWTVFNFDKCSDLTLTYVDTTTSNLCVGPFSSIIRRTWKITDSSKNSSSCSHTIRVNQASIDDVVFPGNYDSATGPFESLEACGSWIKIATGLQFAGNPSPESTGYPTGVQCLKSSVSFVDVRLPICGPNTFKIIRTWKVIDHCNSRTREMKQLIAVMDTRAPIITCPADLTSQPIGGPIQPAAVVFASEYSCGGEWNVLPPVVINDCSSTTWEVAFILADNQGLPPLDGIYTKKSGITEVVGIYPNFKILNLPAGRTWIRYTVTDICGNSSDCFTEVDVIDNQPPTPVCDKNTIIAVASNGIANAGVLVFDDGSHDNCAIDYMKVRRMDQNPSWASLPINNTIQFTCADIGKVIIVELGVWDKGGRTNSCMVEVRVQDNIFPVLTVPANTTANCTDIFTSLTRFGAATVIDNCSATITETRLDAINDCGIGTITRTFTATDTYGNRVVRTQVITVRNNSPVTNNDIRWPQNITLNNNCVANTKPEDLPIANGFPVVFRNALCAQVAYNYEDLVFTETNEACAKILRKWTVLDWCQSVPNTEIGRFQYTQVIMVNNIGKPTILAGCRSSDLTITQIADCTANVRVTAVGTDDCTAEALLRWSYSIDEGDNGSLEVTNATGNSVNRNFTYGTHRITWSVRDACNNLTTCSNVFTIADTKKPTPYCQSEIVTVIMPTSKEVSIWASDFDLGATDNCSNRAQITTSFSATNRLDISRTIKCEDLDGEASKEFTFDVYAIDAAGNSDFCTVKVLIQSNNNSCGNGGPSGKSILISGNVYNEKEEMVSDVTLELISNQAEFPKSVKTTNEGKFAFSDLPMYKDYSLTPYRNDDILNGVSTLDLVMIQRHLLNIEAITSPYKLIAADINNSTKITAADLSDLRKAILGISPVFNNNTSWKFVDFAYIFPDPKHPTLYPQSVGMNNMDYNKVGVDFMAVKIGDVNESAIFNGASSGNITTRSAITAVVNHADAAEGQVFTLDLDLPELSNVLGLQMAFAFDPNQVELLDVKSTNSQITDANFGFANLSKGVINFSWNTDQAVRMGIKTLTFTFRAMRDVKDSDVLSLLKTSLQPELYHQDGNSVSTRSINLNSGSKDEAAPKFELFQNVPNPFNSSTSISFTLPKDNMVTLKVYDLTGKLIYNKSGKYTKGHNTLVLDANSLNANGVLYYQLDTETDSAKRKMIVIK